ncbi:unnamed protein product, partial [Amoebophrya sp. A120]
KSEGPSGARLCPRPACPPSVSQRSRPPSWGRVGVSCVGRPVAFNELRTAGPDYGCLDFRTRFRFLAPTPPCGWACSDRLSCAAVHKNACSE